MPRSGLTSESRRQGRRVLSPYVVSGDTVHGHTRRLEVAGFGAKERGSAPSDAAVYFRGNFDSTSRTTFRRRAERWASVLSRSISAWVTARQTTWRGSGVATSSTSVPFG